MSKPKFAKRHYEAIAQVIQDQERVWVGNDLQVADTAYALARMFKADNPNFNPERFIAACQPGANKDAAVTAPRTGHFEDCECSMCHGRRLAY